ncbi:glutamine amidotransferase [Leptolyngbya valderiana BDU 20041]|nr:glutamine amidotransferase [Geitlerinema sp. CS-897]OAB55379.1 glutamine amidotransferase [Leptolyngbya valderiana BDU 20041]PPT09443.1 hypothetical protein CKA32_002401 [Geitlerinema sp. FC II]
MKPLPILVIVHQPTSDSGRVGEYLQEMGYDLDVRIPAVGQALPPTLDRHSATVVFGGPMSANDDNKLLHIRQELHWIPVALNSRKPFLGICLGAQLLARVLGVNVSRHPDNLVEIGYYPIEATPEGRSLFGNLSYVYQWHSEGFEIPPGATRLATGERFPNQAFCYENAYAFQFHPEMTRSILARWLVSGASQLSQPGAQSGHLHRRGYRRHTVAVNQWLDRFLPQWLNSVSCGEAMRK